MSGIVRRYISVAAIPVLAILLSSSTLAQRPSPKIHSKAIKLLVDGKPLRTSPAPVIRRGRLFIPVTAFRKIGLAVAFEERGHTWVGWPKRGHIIDFKAGRGTYTVDGPEPQTEPLPGIPFVRQGMLMVPLRSMLSDKDVGTSLTAEWNGRTRTVHVHRSKRWLRWRLEQNDELIKGSRGWYTTPI